MCALRNRPPRAPHGFRNGHFWAFCLVGSDLTAQQLSEHRGFCRTPWALQQSRRTRLSRQAASSKARDAVACCTAQQSKEEGAPFYPLFTYIYVYINRSILYLSIKGGPRLDARTPPPLRTAAAAGCTHTTGAHRPSPSAAACVCPCVCVCVDRLCVLWDRSAVDRFN